jgi:hypothetical protein
MRLPALFGIMLWLSLSPCISEGQGLLTDSGEYPKQYLINLSGNAGTERFTGVRGILTLEQPPPLSLNAYLVIIKGYPQTNSRNCFYWFSEDTSMTDVGNEIVCNIKGTYLKQPDVHFFFLSPTLLKNKSPFLTQREKERKKMAEKRALPTKVYAQAGKLSLSILGDQASGAVWMKGYDAVEHSYVDYSASFSGQQTLPIEPKREFKK